MNIPTYFLTIFSSFVFCLLCPSDTIEAAQVYAILVADTESWELSWDAGTNLDMIHQQAKKIAACNELPLKIAIFEEYQVRKKNILNYIVNMKIDPDDIVLFYSHCKGVRAKNLTNPWPDLQFVWDEIYSSTDASINFDVLNEILKSKNPRFLLSIADASNNDPNAEVEYEFSEDDESVEDDEDIIELSDEIHVDPSEPSPEDDSSSSLAEFNIDELNFDDFGLPDDLLKRWQTTKPTNEFQYDNHDLFSIRLSDEAESRESAYNLLFKNVSGTVIVSSSSPGEESLRGFHSFTPQFLQILNESANNVSLDKLSWELILKKVQKRVAKESKVLRPRFQQQTTVQYELDLQ